MKIGFDRKKSAEALTAVAQSTADISKKVAGGLKSGTVAAIEKTKEGTSVMVEKARSDAYARRLKKYNPLFPEQYNSTEFKLPNIIVIVDDAVRKDIDVCEGAIGWLGKENDVEILYLYDEIVPTSGIQFVPAATCDAVYYMDSFERNIFIKAENYFKKIQEEKTAELEHIAHSLGAKSCSIELVELQKTAQEKKKKVELKEKFKLSKNEESAEQSAAVSNATTLSSKSQTKFQGNNIPQKPTLKWFTHDNQIKNLIAARCSGDNSITERNMEFQGSSFTTMSLKAACAIDCAIATMNGVSGNSFMEEQATKLQESKMFFRVEF